MKKRALVFFMVIVLAAVFTGCNMLKVNEERDGQQIVAVVNGSEILKSTITKNIKTILSQYGYSETDSGYADAFNSVAESLLENEIQNTIVRLKCEEYGVELITAEQQEEIDTMLANLSDNVNAAAGNKFTEEEYPDEAERESLKKEYVEKLLTENGYYDGSYADSFKASYMKTNLTDYLTKDYNPTDDDVKAKYDQEMKDQKDVFSSGLSQLDTIEKDSVLVYVPEGIRYVKSILVAIPEDAQSEITELRNNGDSEAADAKREEELKKIEAKANEARKAAIEDFDAALEKYNEDPGMNDEETRKQGYRIYEGNTTYMSAFVEGGMKLNKIGDVSELVATDYGYHIIQYMSDMESGEKSFEEVKDELREWMVDKNYSETFDSNLGIWLEELSIVKYPDKLKYSA